MSKGCFSCTAFRGYNLPRFMHMLADTYGLDIHIESSGLIMVDYYVNLEGTSEDMQAFMKEMNETFERINNI